MRACSARSTSCTRRNGTTTATRRSDARSPRSRCPRCVEEAIFCLTTRAIITRVAPCPTSRTDEKPMNGGYLVIVPAADRALFEYLEHRFKGDPSTSVLVERRKVARPSPRAVVLFHG